MHTWLITLLVNPETKTILIKGLTQMEIEATFHQEPLIRLEKELS